LKKQKLESLKPVFHFHRFRGWVTRRLSSYGMG
jgi:hypothetical protein